MSSFTTHTKKGFTLIELLVVISIISLLSSIVMASLSRAKNKAQVTKVIQETKQFQVAMEQYRVQNGAYLPRLTSIYYPSEISEIATLMKPYIDINSLSFIKPTYDFYYLSGGWASAPANGWTACGGVPVKSDGYMVIFTYPLVTGQFPTGSGSTAYSCITNI